MLFSHVFIRILKDFSFTSRSMIQFKLIFCVASHKELRQWLLLLFFYIWVSNYFSTICWKSYPLSNESFLILHQKSVNHICEAVSLFCSVDHTFCLFTKITILITIAVYESWNQMVWMFHFLFQNYFGYFSFFAFPYIGIPQRYCRFDSRSPQ